MSGKLFETNFKLLVRRFDWKCFLILLFYMNIDRVAGDLGTDVSKLFDGDKR